MLLTSVGSSLGGVSSSLAVPLPNPTAQLPQLGSGSVRIGPGACGSSGREAAGGSRASGGRRQQAGGNDDGCDLASADLPSGAFLETGGTRESNKDDGGSCGICMDRGDFLAVSKCGHRLCVECASELLRVHPVDPVPCPFCRGPIEGFKLSWDET